MQHLIKTSLAVATLASLASAQFTTIVPAIVGAGEGASSTAYPWGRGTASIRSQTVYDSTNFASVVGPMTITRLRWRANGIATISNGGTYAGGAVVMLSTSPLDQAAASTTFANNHGADVTTVYTGAVTVMPSAGTTPNNWYVDIPLSTPFTYNPANGDLTLDVALDGAQFTGVTPTAVDCATTNSLTSRVYNLTSNTATTGSFQANVGITMEVTYVQNGLFAAFGANVTGGATPLTVQFTDQSFSSDPGGITSWAWDLDGDTIVDSALQNPSFTYTTCGSFSPSLTVTDATHPASTNTRTNMIVTDIITADFSHQLIAPLTVLFTDTSNVPATSWAWDFDGDNVVDSTSQSGAWVYPNTNAVNVTLTVSRLCSPPSTITKSIVPAQELTTTFAGGLTGAYTGSLSLFDMNVLNPQGININAFAVNSNTAVGSPFTIDVYLKQGGFAGSESTIGDWNLVGTATGTTAGNLQRSIATLAQPFYLPTGSYALGIHHTNLFNTYTSVPSTYGNGDLSLTLGTVRSTLFGGSTFTGRTWNGTIYYDTISLSGRAGFGFFGKGCPGALGTPALTGSGRPMLGQTFTVTVDRMPVNVGMLAVGFSNTQWGLGALPFDLTVFSMPGCFARVSTDVIVPLAGANNSASFSAPIPSSSAAIGLQFFTQALVNDPAANAYGAVTSDAGAGILGN